MVIIRLFLGGFFLFTVYSMFGAQTDFFNLLQVATARGGMCIVGNYVAPYAAQLQNIVSPNAQLIGWVIMIVGAIVGGLLVFGLFTRFAAILGIVLNTAFLLATAHLGFQVPGLQTQVFDAGMICVAANAAFIVMEFAVIISSPGLIMGLDGLRKKGKPKSGS